MVVGKERIKAERRQLGGLMLLLATCVTLQPLPEIVSLIGRDDTRSAIEISSLASGLVQVVFGSLGMLVGYLNLFHDYRNGKLSGALILLVQSAWAPFVTSLTEVGKAASSPYVIETQRTISNGAILLEEYISTPFIPDDYLPTKRDVRLFGAMGVIGIICYGVAFFGSLAFTAFAIYAFDSGKPMSRDARYYRGRLVLYSFVLVIAGMSQLLLGGYVLYEFGNGPLSPPMGVAMYKVHYPEITVAIGSLQMLVGYYGVARYLAFSRIAGPSNNQFQILLAFQWIAMLLLQYIVQIGYGYDTGNENAAIASYSLLSVALNVLPAFLDFKMRTVPRIITKDYYGIMPKDRGSSSKRRTRSGLQKLESDGSNQEGIQAGKDLEAGKPEFENTVTPLMSPSDNGGRDSDSNSTELHALEKAAKEEQKSTPPPPPPADFIDILERDGVNDPSEHLDPRTISNGQINQLYDRLDKNKGITEPETPSIESGERTPEPRDPSERRDPRTIGNDEMNELYDILSPAVTEPRSNKSSGKWGDGIEHYTISLNDLPETIQTDGMDVSSHDQSSIISGEGLSELDEMVSTDVSAVSSSDSQHVGNEPSEGDVIIDNLALKLGSEAFSNADEEPRRGGYMDGVNSVEESIEEYISIHDSTDGIDSIEEYLSIQESSSSVGNVSSEVSVSFSEDSPDDSTVVLEQKLEEIEKELLTDSIESFRKELTELF